ncbi:hypothetical protein T09_9042 [Trichinella sp. T9]|nr:hypothetical protein T09_9042 [Trichinella sp. T9]
MVPNESACERNWMKFSLAYGSEFYCEQNRTNKRLIVYILTEFKKFQCTKTGFERCAMQITIAIKVKLIKQSKSENACDTKQITDGTKQNKRRQVKFQCAKTGFERCAMQITIAIKVPYRQ